MHSANVVGNLVGKHGFVRSKESTCEVIFPTEIAGIGGWRFHCNDWHMAWSSGWVACCILDELLNDTLEQCRLPYPCRTHNQDERGSCGITNGMQKGFIHLLEPLVCHHFCLKVV